MLGLNRGWLDCGYVVSRCVMVTLHVYLGGSVIKDCEGCQEVGDGMWWIAWVLLYLEEDVFRF